MSNQFIARIGSKRSPVLKRICEIMPDHFDTYVEPFLGSGRVFITLIDRFKDSTNILNDKDEILIQYIKLFLKIDPAIFRNTHQNFIIKNEDLPIHYSKIPKGDCDIARYIELYYLLCGGYSGKPVGDNKHDTKKIYAKFPKTLDKKIQIIQKKMKKVRHYDIQCRDYKEVIREHNKEGTFLYLDPPYRSNNHSVSLYKHSFIDYEEMRDILKDFKGKFILSINDDEYIREIFKDYNMIDFDVIGAHRVRANVGRGTRRELIIYN